MQNKEFEQVGFSAEGKTGSQIQCKPLGAKKRTKNTINPHMALTPGDSHLITVPIFE